MKEHQRKNWQVVREKGRRNIMKRETIRIHGDISNYIDLIQKEITTDIFDGDFTGYIHKPSEDIYIYVNEKFYFRNLCDLMVCIIINTNERQNCLINIFAGGGGSGIFRIDLGAKSNIINRISSKIETLCKANGLEISNGNL